MAGYDPLDYRNLAESIARALLEQPIGPLPPDGQFPGAGAYAIYYTGSFRAYGPIRGTETPIYVGKAIPTGGRRGGTELDPGTVLWRRLGEHADSIRATRNLRIQDFRCRYLVVMPVWISLAESILIRQHQPLWNIIVDGFGNHDPGSGRYRQKRSDWDSLHPGREWVERCQPGRRTEAEILARIRESLA